MVLPRGNADDLSMQNLTEKVRNIHGSDFFDIPQIEDWTSLSPFDEPILEGKKVFGVQL